MKNGNKDNMRPKDQERNRKDDNQVIKDDSDKDYSKEEANFKNPAKKRENSEQPPHKR